MNRSRRRRKAVQAAFAKFLPSGSILRSRILGAGSTVHLVDAETLAKSIESDSVPSDAIVEAYARYRAQVPPGSKSGHASLHALDTWIGELQRAVMCAAEDAERNGETEYCVRGVTLIEWEYAHRGLSLFLAPDDFRGAHEADHIFEDVLAKAWKEKNEAGIAEELDTRIVEGDKATAKLQIDASDDSPIIPEEKKRWVEYVMTNEDYLNENWGSAPGVKGAPRRYWYCEDTGERTWE